MTILGIEAAIFGVEDIDRCAAFLEDAGMEVEKLSPSLVIGRIVGEGRRVELRQIDDPSLPPAIEPGSTLREIVWGVADQAAIDSIRAEFSDRDTKLDDEGRLHLVGAGGLGLAFEISRSKQETQPSARTRPARIARYDRPKPDHLGHVGIFTDKVDEVSEFFIDRLGFTQSDEIANSGRFLRAPGSINHHSIFVCKRPQPGVQHLSFRVRDIDELGVGARYLEGRGWKKAWGPGRWGPGSDVYVFFVNPAGGLLELHCDEDFIVDVDQWKPQVWNVADIVLWGDPPPFLASMLKDATANQKRAEPES